MQYTSNTKNDFHTEGQNFFLSDNLLTVSPSDLCEENWLLLQTCQQAGSESKKIK